MSESTRSMIYAGIWIFFILSMMLIGYFVMKIIKRRRDSQKQFQEKQDNLREKYQYLTSDQIDEIEDEDLASVIYMQCEKKEDEYDDFIDQFNEVEKVVYAIYNMNVAASSKIGIRSFFMSPNTADLVDEVDTIYTNIGFPELGQLLAYTRRLHEIMENNLDDEDMGEYSRYNFSDFTNDYISSVSGTNFTTKVIQYIRDNKHIFDKENDDENISDEV